MQFDWFTIIAQLVNFAILVFLLYKFLFKRVTKKMDERKAEIEERFRKAEEMKREYEELRQKLRDKEKRLEDKRSDILNEAEKEAGEERKRIIEEAKNDAEKVKEKWLEDFENEKKKSIEELRKQIGAYVFKTCKKVMKEFASKDFEEGILQKFQEKIKDSIEENEDAMKKAAREAEGRVTVSTVFEIDDGSRGKIKEILDEKLNIKTVNFERDSTLISGIEMKIDGQVVSWNIKDYLDDIEQDFLENFKEKEEKGKESV